MYLIDNHPPTPHLGGYKKFSKALHLGDWGVESGEMDKKELIDKH
jgi:hypothetical protein